MNNRPTSGLADSPVLRLCCAYMLNITSRLGSCFILFHSKVQYLFLALASVVTMALKFRVLVNLEKMFVLISVI